jgi:hypothetical protein
VSPLLETFKAKKNRNWTLLDITGETANRRDRGNHRKSSL